MIESWPQKITIDYLQSFPIYHLRRNFIKQNIPIFKGMRICEAGSGPAHDSLIFAENGARVTAVDLSINAIKNAERIYFHFGYPIETFIADIKKLPFNDNIFDLTWNAGTLEHFTDAELEKVFREMFRVTKKGGIILVFVPNKYYFWYQWHLKFLKFRQIARQYEFERSFSVFYLIKLFYRYNLNNIKVSGVHIHPASHFIIPKTYLLTKILKWIFTPLENTKKLGLLKSILGLDVVIFGKK